jgi:hypothetical protein
MTKNAENAACVTNYGFSQATVSQCGLSKSKFLSVVGVCLVLLFSLSTMAFAGEPTPLTFTACGKVDVTSLHALSAPINNSMYAAVTVTAEDMFGWQSALILWVADNGKVYAISDQAIGKEGQTYALPKKIGNSPLGRAYLFNPEPLMYSVAFFGFGEKNNYGNTPIYVQLVQEGQSINWDPTKWGVPTDKEFIGIAENYTLYGWMMQDTGNPYYYYGAPDAKIVLGNLNLIPFTLPD